MKVALVSSGSGSRGGGEIYLRFLADGLRTLGHEVLVLVPEANRMDELADSLRPFAEVRRFAFLATYERKLRSLGAWLDWPQQARLTKLFRDLDVDMLHINQQVAEDGLDLVMAAERSGRPWVSTIHVGHSAQALGAQLGKGRDWVTAKVLQRIGGHHIAVSASSAAQLEARFDRPQIHTVMNGVPVPSSEDLQAAREQARSDWGVSECDIVIGSVGRIEAQKAPLDLVDHLAPIAQSQAGLHLVWIGDGSLRDELTAHAAPHRTNLPLTIDGWRSDAALRLAGLDLFALPSVFEGLPLALLEAMHAGLPVVASRADGIAEAVEHGVTGFLCKSPDEWRSAFEQLTQDHGLRQRMGEAGKQAALAQFSTDAIAQATVRIYEPLI